MAPLHEGSSAGKSDLCCGRSLDVVGRPGLHQSSPVSICFAGCSSPGPRKNDLTIYWALGPFVRSFTLLVDPGDIYPPHWAIGNLWHGRNIFFLHQKIHGSLGAVLNDLHHHASEKTSKNLMPSPLHGAPNVGEGILWPGGGVHPP
jgi:hypothetical protein